MEVDVSPDHHSMSQAAARRVEALVRSTLAGQDTFALALAGGHTPRRLYQLLAEAHLPWSSIHLFWGDERFVPHTDPQSNVRLVRETLLRDIDIPAANVHPVPIKKTPANAATAYADVLQHTFAGRGHTFDLALLGMGGDGHTASLFPEHKPHLDDRKWVRPVTAPPRHAVRQRITCTLRVFNAALQAFVLVSGASKRETVQSALVEKNNRLPITHVHPQNALVWFLDEAARPTQSV